MSFTVPIYIDAAGTDTAVRKVTTELERAERIGKAAGEIVSKALQSGKLHADQAAAATAAYTRELMNAERAAEKAAAAAAKIQSGGFRSFLSDLQSGVGGMTSFAANLSMAAGGVTGLVNGLASGAKSLFDWHAGLAFVNDGLIQMRNRLRNVTQGQAELAASMEITVGIANRTFTSWNTTIDVFARVANVTNQLGFSLERTGRFTETLQKLFASSGRSSAEASAAMLQFGQALGSGVLQGDEFKSIAENMPQLLDAFAARLGVTRGELKKLASEGKIGTDVMIGGIEDMAKRADVAFASMEKTFAQRMQPTLNAMQQDPRLINKAVSDPTKMLDLIGNSPTEFLEGMPAMGAAAEEFGLDLPSLKVSDFNKEIGRMSAAVGKLAGDLGSAIPPTRTWANDLSDLVAKTTALNPPAKTFNETIAALTPKIADAKTETYGLADALKDGKDSTIGFAKSLGTALFPALFDTWSNGVKPMATGISELEKLFKSIVEPARNFTRDLRNLDTLLARKRITTAEYATTLADLQDKFRNTGTSDWRALSVGGDEYANTLQRVIDQTKFLLDLNEQFGASTTFNTAGTNGLGAAASTGPNPLAANFLNPADDALRQRATETDRWTKALKKNEDSWKSLDSTIRDMGNTVINDFSSALMDSFKTGEVGAKKMVDAIMMDLGRMATNKFLQSLFNVGMNAAMGPGGGGWSNGQTSAYPGGFAHGGSWTAPPVHHAAHGLRIGGSSTVGDKVPFFAMVNSGETVDIRNRFQQGDRGGAPVPARERVIYVENGRQLTAAQRDEEVIRIVQKAGFTRGR